MSYWTDDEIALLLSGQPVPDRSAFACDWKLRKLGIRKGPGHYRAKALYEAPKPIPGKIPWPGWWRRAHLMRVEGYRASDIAQILGQDLNAVDAALYPQVHERQLERNRRGIAARRRRNPDHRIRGKGIEKAQDPVRAKARVLAHAEWRAAGGDPAALESFYRKFDCL